ncbi:MAG: hypothetical protein JST40_10890 [Armatimonadetes bacterium]|nr:hypothetical protein [Armatimonadota bacterium]
MAQWGARWVGVVILATGSVGAHSVPASKSIRDTINRARAALGSQPRATEAKGFTPDSTRPLPAPREDKNTFRLLNMDKGSGAGNKVRGEGHIHFTFRGYEVWADKVDGDRETQVFTLEGNVRVAGEEQSAEAERAIVDFRARTMRYESGRGSIGPKPLGGQLRAPLYVTGTGFGGTGRFFGVNSSLTTCEYPDPHYQLVARSIDVIPSKRAILRHVKVEILHKTVVTLPFMVIPLNERMNRYSPEVGQSREEGYYIKNSIGIPLRGSSFVNARTDYFTKLGAGLGGDWNYSNRTTAGLIRAYGLTGTTPSRLYSVDHRQMVLGGKLNVVGQWIQDNYLTALNTRTYNIRSNFTRPLDGGNLRLSLNRSGSRSSTFRNLNQTMSLEHQQKWNPRSSTSLNIDFNTYRTSGLGGLSEQKAVNLNFKASQDLSRAQALFDYQRVIPVASSVPFFSSQDRTPMFTLSTASNRWTGLNRDRFPWRAEYSVGELGDSLRKSRVTRNHLDLSTNNELGERSRHKAGYDLRFRQGFYSDSTAQYNWSANLHYGYSVGPKSQLNLRYSTLRQQGFTPLAIDRTGERNELSSDLSWKILPSLSLGAQSSFDFVQFRRHETPWQGVGVRSEWYPDDKFFLRFNANYDTFRSAWSNLRFDSGWKVSEGYMSVGLRYDGIRHTWGNVNLFAEGLRWKRLKTSALLNFNGYTGRFDTRQLSFIYDLHCAEAIFQIIDQSTGYRRGTEFGLFIRLKALPFDTPFGVGRRGQAIGTGTGIGF